MELREGGRRGSLDVITDYRVQKLDHLVIPEISLHVCVFDPVNRFRLSSVLTLLPFENLRSL